MNQKIILVPGIIFFTVLTYTYFRFSSSLEFDFSNMKNFKVVEQYSKQLVEKCNSDFLRKAFFKNNMSYTEGSWVNDTWEPSNCEFSSNKSILHKCLPDLKVRKILILGDSNGRRWGDAALRLLLKEFKCDLLKKEIHGTRYPTQEYFKDVKDGKFQRRNCVSCTSFLYHCEIEQQNARNSNYDEAASIEIDLEFLSMEYYMDDEMTTQRGPKQCKNTHKHPFIKNSGNCGESNTTQQFIFNEYLYTQYHYPTLILVIGTNHEPEKRGYADFKRAFTWFLELLQNAVHNNTRVYWIEQTYVTTKGKRISKKYGQYKFWALQVISQYYESKPHLFYPFYGIYDLSKNKTEWLKDGLHYSSKLYTAFMELFFKTLCE